LILNVSEAVLWHACLYALDLNTHKFSAKSGYFNTDHNFALPIQTVGHFTLFCMALQGGFELNEGPTQYQWAPGETRRRARAHRLWQMRTKTGTLLDCKGIDGTLRSNIKYQYKKHTSIRNTL
jgi:hypothetical protein